MKIKFKFIGLAVLTVALLTGCEEASMVVDDETLVDAKTNIEDVSTEPLTEEEKAFDMLPENVKNGTVSEDVYSEATRFIREFGNYSVKVVTLQKKVNEDFSLLDDPTFKQEYDNALDEYEVFIKGFHVSPSTTTDFEINDNFGDMLYTYVSYIGEMRRFVDTKDTFYTKSASQYNTSIKTSYTALLNTLEKYDLFLY